MPSRTSLAPRAALIGLDGFVALTATGGGLALAGGLEGGRFPRSWLRRTPFPDYRVPGVLLAGVVGGSAAVACIEQVRGRSSGWSVLAGAALIVWISAEVVLLDQPVAPTPMEVGYFAIGAGMVGLGVLSRRGSSAELGSP